MMAVKSVRWRAKTGIVVHVLGAGSGQMLLEMNEFFDLGEAAEFVRYARDYGYSTRVGFYTAFEKIERYHDSRLN